jgi:Ca2+-binding RTX toxin-like protein
MTHSRRRRAVVATTTALGTAFASAVLAAPAQAATTATFIHGLGILTIAGDAASNTIVVSRDAAGAIRVNGGAVDIHGATATVANVDLIAVFGAGGNDTIALDETNGALPRAALDGGYGDDRLTGGSGDDRLSGRAGNDTLLGKGGADRLAGGDGDDFVDGDQGSDIGFLGDGDDTFQWDPGDGSDVVEGQAGRDTMLFNGANLGESFVVSASGERVRFTRDIGTIVMDLDDVERIDTNALGGEDKATVGDLSGTDVTRVGFNLAAASGAPDGQNDSVTVDGTGGDDAVVVTGSLAGGVSVSGLAASATVTGTDGPGDSLTVKTLAGDDVIRASGLAAGVVTFTGSGGDGDDILVGSAGDDTLLGGAGDDVLNGGPGTDLLDGGPGANVLIP